MAAVFNLAMGLVGLAMSAGATISTTVAGFVTQHLGTRYAFIVLGLAATAGCLLVLFRLPETGHLQAASARAATVKVQG